MKLKSLISTQNIFHTSEFSGRSGSKLVNFGLMLNCFSPLWSGENIIGLVRDRGCKIYYFSVRSGSGQKITAYNRAIRGRGAKNLALQDSSRYIWKRLAMFVLGQGSQCQLCQIQLGWFGLLGDTDYVSRFLLRPRLIQNSWQNIGQLHREYPLHSCVIANKRGHFRSIPHSIHLINDPRVTWWAISKLLCSRAWCSGCYSSEWFEHCTACVNKSASI